MYLQLQLLWRLKKEDSRPVCVKEKDTVGREGERKDSNIHRASSGRHTDVIPIR